MTDEELKSLFETLGQGTAALREDNSAIRRENAIAREENAAAHEATRRDFHQTVDLLSEDNRRHFEVFTEQLDKRFDLLAEVVQTINENVGRRVGAVEVAIGNSAAETQAMIKFSHDELQRRVRVLEETQRIVEQTLADMQTRLERLETSTH